MHGRRRFQILSVIFILAVLSVLTGYAQAAHLEPKRSPLRLQTGSLLQDGSLDWNIFLGQDLRDRARGVTVDTDGDVYITGDSWAGWGDPVNPYTVGHTEASVARLDSNGSLIRNTSRESTSDVFVAKLDSNGNLIWNTFLGSTDDDSGYAVVVDPNGYIYVAGTSFGSWGSPVDALTTPLKKGSCAGFVAKLDRNGTLIWNTFPGSVSADFIQGIAVDRSGNSYITGISSEGWGNPVNDFSGRGNAFVARLGPNGSVVWNTFLPSNWGIGFDIALDVSGNSYVAGQGHDSQGTSLDPDITAAFVAKVDNRGTLLWNTYLARNDRLAGANGTGIALDRASNVYVTGMSSGAWGSPVNPYGGNPQIFTGPGPETFVAKLNRNGALVWNTFFSGAHSWGYDIALDSDANSYVTGFAKGSWGAPIRPFSADPDAFVAKVDHNGALLWNTFLGGGRDDFGLSIAVDPLGNVYEVGETSSTWGSMIVPFSRQSALEASVSDASRDAFVAKLQGDAKLQKAGMQNAGSQSADPNSAEPQQAAVMMAAFLLLGLWVSLALIPVALEVITSQCIEQRPLRRKEI